MKITKIYGVDALCENFSWNLIEISTGKTKILLACGRKSPPSDDPFGYEDIYINGLTYDASAYDAVFVTHHHSDHRGFLELINPGIPVYMNKDVKKVLDVIADFNDIPLARVDKYLEHGHREKVGDITVLPLEVDHRTMGRMLLLIEADGQKILYTDGFKHIDPAYYALLGKIDVLLYDGINIGEKNDIPISDLQDEATRIMRQAKGHVFVLCSPTDADRIQHIERACRESGRSMAIDPFLKAILEKLTRPLIVDPCGFIPYIDMEVTPRIHKHIIGNRDVEFNEIQNFSSAEALAKMTGLAFMVRPSMNDFLTKLNALTPLTGSTLIYYMWEGYKRTAPVKEFIDMCLSLGMKSECLCGGDYAFRRQLKAAVTQLEPEIMIPIQAEHRYLFYDMPCSVNTLGCDEIYDCGMS